MVQRSQHAFRITAKGLLAKNDEVIEALLLNSLRKSLRVGILIRRPRDRGKGTQSRVTARFRGLAPPAECPGPAGAAKHLQCALKIASTITPTPHPSIED